MVLGLRHLRELFRPRPTPLDRFTKLAAASGLVTPDNLASALNQFRRTKLAAATDEQTVAAFSNYLIDREMLTRWQCEKLNDGRWKGFFIERYKLLEHLCDEDELVMVLLAEDMQANHQVELRVMPVPRVGRIPHVGYRTAGDVLYKVTELTAS